MDLNHSSTSDSVIVGHTPHAARVASSRLTRPSPFTSSAWNMAASASRRSSFPAVSARGRVIARGVRGVAGTDAVVIARRWGHRARVAVRLSGILFRSPFLNGAHLHRTRVVSSGKAARASSDEKKDSPASSLQEARGDGTPVKPARCSPLARDTSRVTW